MYTFLSWLTFRSRNFVKHIKTSLGIYNGVTQRGVQTEILKPFQNFFLFIFDPFEPPNFLDSGFHPPCQAVIKS